MPYPTTLQQVAYPVDALGVPILGQPITWESLEPLVATVDANGLITAVGVGVAVVVATCGGITASTTVTVLTQ